MDKCQRPFITFSLYFHLFHLNPHTPGPDWRSWGCSWRTRRGSCARSSRTSTSPSSTWVHNRIVRSTRLFSAVTLACLACDISISIWNAGDHWFLCLCKNVSLHINMKEGKEKFTAPCIIQKKRWKSACSYVGVDVWGFLYPPNQLKLKISARWGSSQNPNWGASLMYGVS